MIVDVLTDTSSRQASQKMAPFLSCAELLKHLSGNSRILAAGETFVAVAIVFLFLQGSFELMFGLRARSDFSGALSKDRALITCLSCASSPSSWSVVVGLVPPSCFARMLVPSSLSDSLPVSRICKMARNGSFCLDHAPIIYSAPEALLCSKFCLQNV